MRIQWLEEVFFERRIYAHQERAVDKGEARKGHREGGREARVAVRRRLGPLDRCDERHRIRQRLLRLAVHVAHMTDVAAAQQHRKHRVDLTEFSCSRM